jgi:hypothetical protein
VKSDVNSIVIDIEKAARRIRASKDLSRRERLNALNALAEVQAILGYVSYRQMGGAA